MAAIMASPPLASADDNLEAALTAFERSRYAEAVELLHSPAQGGNPRAQEMLGLMHLYGSRLFGAEVPRDLDQARYWLRRAALAGSAVANHALRWTESLPAHADTSLAVQSRPGGKLALRPHD